MGRPLYLCFRASEDEREQLRRAAERKGVPLSAFVRAAALKEAA